MHIPRRYLPEHSFVAQLKRSICRISSGLSVFEPFKDSAHFLFENEPNLNTLVVVLKSF